MMRAPNASLDDRGSAAIIFTAAMVSLLAVSVHFHILCSVICLHGEDAMMTDDICHSAAQAEAVPEGFAARMFTLTR